LAPRIHLDLINWKSLQVLERGSPGPKIVDSLGRNFGHGTRHILAFIGNLGLSFTVNMEFIDIPARPFFLTLVTASLHEIRGSGSGLHIVVSHQMIQRFLY
jgi:hypothetical protein